MNTIGSYVGAGVRAVSEFSQDFAGTSMMIAEDWATELGKTFAFCGKKVEKFTEQYLPKPLAPIFNRAFYAAPTIIAYQFLPGTVIVLALPLYAILSRALPSYFKENPLRGVWASIADGFGTCHLYAFLRLAVSFVRNYNNRGADAPFMNAVGAAACAISLIYNLWWYESSLLHATEKPQSIPAATVTI